MKCTGKFVGAEQSLFTGELTVTLKVNEAKECLEQINLFNANKDDLLDIEIKKYRKKRSLDANALMWACIGEVAKALGEDKWIVYLSTLKKYGKFTYVVVKPNVVEAVKQQWRECEVVGDIDVNGTKAVQMLCYFGSSTYDSKEFSVLLEGLISDMKELGLQPPTSKEMRRSLELWEKRKS